MQSLPQLHFPDSKQLHDSLWPAPHPHDGMLDFVEFIKGGENGVGELNASVSGIINPDGKHLGTIKTTQATANCAFNEDESELYITADMYLLRVDLRFN